MLAVAGVDALEARARIDGALANGAAYERMIALVEAQGGTRAALEGLRVPAQRVAARAGRAGFVQAVDATAIGEAARAIVEAAGPAAGIIARARIGNRVEAGDVLAEIVGGAGDADALAAAFSIGERAPSPHPLLAAAIRDADPVASSN
jgi:thymidine phosphorylase